MTAFSLPTVLDFVGSFLVEAFSLAFLPLETFFAALFGFEVGLPFLPFVLFGFLAGLLSFSGHLFLSSARSCKDFSKRSMRFSNVLVVLGSSTGTLMHANKKNKTKPKKKKHAKKLQELCPRWEPQACKKPARSSQASSPPLFLVNMKMQAANILPHEKNQVHWLFRGAYASQLATLRIVHLRTPTCAALGHQIFWIEHT